MIACFFSVAHVRGEKRNQREVTRWGHKFGWDKDFLGRGKSLRKKIKCFGLITFESEVVMSWKYAENDRMIRLMGRCEIFYFSWKVVKWSIFGWNWTFWSKIGKKGVLTFFRPNLLLKIFKTFFWLGVFKLPLSIGNSLRSSHHM